MARYIVDSQIDNHEKYYFIREQESQDIVLLPSKYLMHKKRSKLSPNTIRRSAGAISYYLNYIDETGIQLDDVWEMPYNKQHNINVKQPMSNSLTLHYHRLLGYCYKLYEYDN